MSTEACISRFERNCSYPKARFLSACSINPGALIFSSGENLRQPLLSILAPTR